MHENWRGRLTGVGFIVVGDMPKKDKNIMSMIEHNDPKSVGYGGSGMEARMSLVVSQSIVPKEAQKGTTENWLRYICRPYLIGRVRNGYINVIERLKTIIMAATNFHLIARLTGHTGAINCVAFASAGIMSSGGKTPFSIDTT